MEKRHYSYAITAGLFASAASFFGKFTAQARNEIIHEWIVKGGCISAMIICNVFVWTFFVKAMHQKGGSLVATVTSATTNYCLSAIIGNIAYGETTSLLWWFGTFLILIGLFFVATDDTVNEENNANKEVEAKKKN